MNMSNHEGRTIPHGNVGDDELIDSLIGRLNALEEKEKKGIVWHWQGSGKSLTMLFAALKLHREEARLKNPYFLVVTDRKNANIRYRFNLICHTCEKQGLFR